MEIELRGLALRLWKSSTKHSISVQPTLNMDFFSCSSKPQKPMNKSNPKQIKPILHKNLRIAWSFRRLGLVRSAPGLLGFCIVAAARHVRSLRFALPEAFAAWVAGFLHRRGGETHTISAFCISWSFPQLGLVRIGAWVSFVTSFFFVLNSLGCWKYLTTALLNWVHWARFPWTKTESSRLDFFA